MIAVAAFGRTRRRRHGRRRATAANRVGSMLRATAPRALDEQRRALRLPQLDRAPLLGARFGAATRGAQRDRERLARVGVVEQVVGRGGDLDGGAREGDRRGVLAAARPAPRRARRARRSPP